MANKTAKNLLQNADTYNAYYGDFRGVDFSSEHTQVHPNRFAYAVNMYKDYRAGQGGSIETIPGYRRVIQEPDGRTIYGIHHFVFKDATTGKNKSVVLVHAGERLYEWDNYPATVGVEKTTSIELGEGVATSVDGFYEFSIPLSAYAVKRVLMPDGEATVAYSFYRNLLTVSSSGLKKGDILSVTYTEAEWTSVKFANMNERKSVSFAMNNKLYILDGKNYLVYDGNAVGKNVKHVKDDAYVPTTRVGIIPTGEDESEGEQHEQRNLLQPKFKQTFRADGANNTFILTEKEANVILVRVHGTESKSEEYTTAGSKVTFSQAAPSSDEAIEAVFYPASYKGVVVNYSAHFQRYVGNATFSFIEYASETFAGDDSTKTFVLDPKTVSDYTRSIDIRSVVVYGESVDYSFDSTSNTITLATAPRHPAAVVNYQKIKYPKDHFGVEITAEKALEKVDGLPSFENSSDLITKCTMVTVFDGRVFLSGNPDCPNRVFYCGRNSDDVADPSYFGEYDHFADGSDSVAIKGMVPVSDVLCVLKEGSAQEGSVYYHTPTETGENVTPKVYPSSEGIGSLGCVGACVNFIDDPVFVSREGLSAIGQLSVRYERAIEHRSSMVDAKLTNEEQLSSAFLTVWDNYLVLFVNGKAYMADSRQRYTDENGVMQYEWYYAEGIGVYDGQYEEYHYASALPELPEGETLKTESGDPIEIIGTEFSYDDLAFHDMRGTVANPPGEDGNASATIVSAGKYSYVLRNGHAYLCEPTGAMTGGTFKKATCAIELGGNLLFGTENGCVCAFNFDKRNALGEIPSQYYSFDGRTILSGCATKMDNCGIPHLTKNTVKKSMVVKTKTLGRSAIKIKVRTNKNPYNQVARISSARFDFENMDFADFSFAPTEQSLFTIREKEKKWVEKQIYLFSDEYCKPFSLFYIAYRYNVAGRYKE